MIEETTTQIEHVAIETRSGRSYVGKLAIGENPDYTILTKKDKRGLLAVKYVKFKPGIFIILEDVYVLIPTKTPEGIQPVPVKFSDMPTGSSAVSIGADGITEINVMDKSSRLLKAIAQEESSIITSATMADAEASSKIIHKFSK